MAASSPTSMALPRMWQFHSPRRSSARRSEFSFDSEFEFGLDLILEALEQNATSAGH